MSGVAPGMRWEETTCESQSSIVRVPSELNRIVAENPFTPFMDVEIMPVVEPSAAMTIYGEVVAIRAAPGQVPV